MGMCPYSAINSGYLGHKNLDPIDLQVYITLTLIKINFKHLYKYRPQMKMETICALSTYGEAC